MSRHPVLACLAAALLAGCAAAPAPLATEAVTSDYAAGGGHFDDGATIIFLTRVFEQSGRVGFCGARTKHSMTARTALYDRQVAGAAALEIAGDRIARGLGALAEARYRDDMTGATARCFLTDRPWRPEYAAAAPEIRIPRLQFAEGDDSLFGIGWGDAVTFRQTPVNRPLPSP
jgi:hypothetical protein